MATDRVNFQISMLRRSHSSFKVGTFVTIVGAGPGYFSRKQALLYVGPTPWGTWLWPLSQHTKTVWCTWLLLVSARTPRFHSSWFSRQVKADVRREGRALVGRDSQRMGNCHQRNLLEAWPLTPSCEAELGRVLPLLHTTLQTSASAALSCSQAKLSPTQLVPKNQLIMVSEAATISETHISQ